MYKMPAKKKGQKGNEDIPIEGNEDIPIEGNEDIPIEVNPEVVDEESQSPSQSQSLLTGGDDDEELEEVQEGGSGEDGGEEEDLESADEAEDEEIADEQPLIRGTRKRTFPMRYNGGAGNATLDRATQSDREEEEENDDVFEEVQKERSEEEKKKFRKDCFPKLTAAEKRATLAIMKNKYPATKNLVINTSLAQLYLREYMGEEWYAKCGKMAVEFFLFCYQEGVLENPKEQPITIDDSAQEQPITIVDSEAIFYATPQKENRRSLSTSLNKSVAKPSPIQHARPNTGKPPTRKKAANETPSEDIAGLSPISITSMTKTPTRTPTRTSPRKKLTTGANISSSDDFQSEKKPKKQNKNKPGTSTPQTKPNTKKKLILPSPVASQSPRPTPSPRHTPSPRAVVSPPPPTPSPSPTPSTSSGIRKVSNKQMSPSPTPSTSSGLTNKQLNKQRFTELTEKVDEMAVTLMNLHRDLVRHMKETAPAPKLPVCRKLSDFDRIEKRAQKYPQQLRNLMTAPTARKFLNCLVTSWTVYNGVTWSEFKNRFKSLASLIMSQYINPHPPKEQQKLRLKLTRYFSDVKQRTKMGQNPDVPMDDEDNIGDNDDFDFTTDEE